LLDEYKVVCSEKARNCDACCKKISVSRSGANIMVCLKMGFFILAGIANKPLKITRLPKL
jgi:ribosomal protein L37AE/L43A